MFISVAKRIWRVLAARPLVRVALQCTVSLALIVMLLATVRWDGLTETLRALEPGAIVVAAMLSFVAYVLNSRRWQILLARAGISRALGHLTGLYLIGQFFSLFLPTSAGGDAVRVYEVSRRGGQVAFALWATLQERLLGLAASLFIGLMASLYYLDVLPEQLRGWIVLVQALGLVTALLVFHPSPLYSLAGFFWSRMPHRWRAARLAATPAVKRLLGALSTLNELPSIGLLRLGQLCALTAVSLLLGIGTAYVLGQALNLDASYGAFCLVVTLVWIVKMLPVSLNGIGVGESAFVILLGRFGVAAEQALALALAVVGVQTALALLGGLLLAIRMTRGSWAGIRQSETRRGERGCVSAPSGCASVASECPLSTIHEGKVRYAA
jgi:uncharacterized protein (TIRG00374 family)